MCKERLAELSAFRKDCHDKVSQIHNRISVLTALQKEEYEKAEVINAQWDAVEKEYYTLRSYYENVVETINEQHNRK